ncbi:MAG: glycerophosphodiester phosphodiesterase [Cyanobacteria bacterium]|nr:glycerophosphodiester phosphodiesterase [Cyanobacteriota bacterium]
MVLRIVKAIVPLLTILALSASAPATKAADSDKTLVIAHRGASGYRPEHTLAAYRLAIELGADYIEPDLVPTKDGVLVARHENEISSTTNVAEHPEFKERYQSKEIDGSTVKGWFTEDFTLKELRTLRARERMPKLRQHNTAYNDSYLIPTFQEIIDVVKQENRKRNRQIGLYPEAKHPSYFAKIGLPTEAKLVDTLKQNGYVDRKAPVYIQCFEVECLKKLRKMTELSLVQLIDEKGQPYDWVCRKDPRTFPDMIKPENLAEIASYAQGIGPNKNLILPRDRDGKLLKPTDLVENAHKAGLVVHPWTFRNENEFLPADLRSNETAPGSYGNAKKEYRQFFDLHVDGVFSENPDTAREELEY